MVLRTIYCSSINCQNSFTEASEGKGWPGWGQVAGLSDAGGIPKTAHVCPECLHKIRMILNGEL